MNFDNAEIEKVIELEKARLELDNRVQNSMNAYLVSLELAEDDPAEIEKSLQELAALVRTLDDNCLGSIIQRKEKPIPSSFIGHGKALEIKAICINLKIDYVIFDQELSPTQVRNLEKLIAKPILDRTGIILQIFKKNARSKEAKTQVEIANLEYIAPRLSNAWITWERQRGSGGSGGKLRGAGETQIELDRRKIKTKIAILKKELLKLQIERETQRKKRSKEWGVALVGYTNAGKTTLMNALTHSKLSAKDSLFETLDSSIRKLQGTNNLNILLSDTVGFIRNLPHGLVASFRSTLSEVALADLICHVVDISNADYENHIKVTQEVLAEVGAQHVPQIFIFTKLDLCNDPALIIENLSIKYPHSIFIASNNLLDMQKCKNTIIDFLARDLVEKTFNLSYAQKDMIDLIHAHTEILQADWQDDLVTFHVRMNKNIYKRYFIDGKK